MTTSHSPRTGLAWPARVRAFAAAGSILALLAGVPLLLATVVGDPLPHHLPTLTDAQHALTRPLPDNAVIDVLATFAWLAWAHLLLSVAVEVVTQLRGLPAPRRVPVLGFNQALAHRLVATALLLVPAATATTAPVAALTRAAAPHPAVQVAAAVTATDVGASPAATPVTDAACAAPVTTRTEAPGPTRPPHKVYVVQPPHGRHYDSLWDIAERHLGDGRRYHEIYQLNRGRPQPDGGELTRASLIQPGWVLLLPVDATGPGVSDGAPTAPQPAPDSTPEPPAPANHPAHRPAPAVPAQTRAPESPATPVTSPPAPSASAPALHAAPAGEDDHSVPAAPVGIGLGVGALAALAALRRARKIAQRRRPIGMRPAPVPDKLRPVEAGLAAEARRVEPVTGAVRLAVALAQQRDEPLSITAVLRHDGGDVDLLLHEPPPAPPPFAATNGGWRLAADASGFAFAVAGAPDPRPALLQLGRHGNADVYVDLRPLGLVAITGDSDADGRTVDDLLATLASRLVGATWSGLVHVMVPERVAHRTGRLDRLEVVADLESRAADLTADARRVALEADIDGGACADPTRRSGAGEPAPLLVLVGWRADEIPGELSDLAADPAVPLLAIVTGHRDDARSWRIASGELAGDGLPVPVTVPARPPAADQVAVLIEHVRTAEPVDRADPAYAGLRADAPPAPEIAEPVPMSVNVLGPVELQGIEMPRRTPAFQTLAYLAVHRRGATSEQLSTALWPDELAASKTVRNRVAEARAVVDGAISEGPGWQLEERVGCDWQRFQTLAAGTFDDRVAALGLVRGQPFDGFTDEWVDAEMLRTDIIAEVIDVAADVAEQALADDNARLAFRAARAGLRASPYEERLFRVAMRAADAEGSTGKLRALMEELRKALDVHVQPDDEMQRETLALYEELSSNARRRARV